MTSDVALIVEDLALLREMYGEMMQEMGLDVVLADSGEVAVALLAEGNVTVLLADMGLGAGMSGLQLAEIVRAQHPHIRVIIVSGHAKIADLPGDYAFVPKPFTYAALQAAIVPRVSLAN